MKALSLTSALKLITDMGMTEGEGGIMMVGKKGWYKWCSRDGERRGFDDKKLWESKRMRSRGADASTYESLKTETQRARDRNRAIKLSVAPLSVTDSRVDVAWQCQQMDRLVLMFYSSVNGKKFAFSHCQPTNAVPLEQTGIKLKPSHMW